ncbi:MAG: WD40-repeat-containing domain protein [Piptocephalis tieghemiana]|nr:MAG: WD40-repeat-containing domain protein [Piptocephalis tieghemiana]
MYITAPFDWEGDVNRDTSGMVRVWNVKRRRVLVAFQASPKALLAVYGLSSMRILTHERTGFICLWDISDDAHDTSLGGMDKPPRLIQRMYVNTFNFCRFTILAPAPPGSSSILAVPSSSGNHGIDIWDLEQGERIYNALYPSTSSLVALSLVYPQVPAKEDGLMMSSFHLYAGYEDGSLAAYHWDSIDSEPTLLWQHTTFKDTVLCLDVSQNGQVLVAGSATEEIAVIDLRKIASNGPKNIQLLPIPGAKGIADVTFCDSQGTYLTAVSWDGRIYLFQPSSSQGEWTIARVIEGHRSSLRAVAAYFPTAGDSSVQDSSTLSSASTSLINRSKSFPKPSWSQEVDWTEKSYFACGGKDGNVTIWSLSKALGQS